MVSLILAVIGMICGMLALARVAANVSWTALGVIFVALAIIVPAVAK